MAGKVINLSLVLLSNFAASRLESAFKNATSHICAERSEQMNIFTQLFIRL